MFDWQTIRRQCLVDGRSRTAVAQEMGISRTTLNKYLHSDVPPARIGAPTRTPTLNEYINDIDAFLTETPRITATRVRELLRERHEDFKVGERAVRRFIAKRKMMLVPNEVFIRQVYQPGSQTQYDFCDVQVYLDGTLTEIHLFTARLSYSSALYAKCFRTEDQAALFDGIACTATHFGGLTIDGVFDNASTAIDAVLKGRERIVNATFAGFIGAYATKMQYAAPRKGNQKGGVEGAHGFIVDNFFRPVPHVKSMKELNKLLLQFCFADLNRRTQQGRAVADLFHEEQCKLRPLPQIAPRACITTHQKINKFSEVRYKTNRYSVPVDCVGKIATIEVYSDILQVSINHEVVAKHDRLFVKGGASIDFFHFIEALKYKHRAIERAEALNSAPKPFRELLARYLDEDRDSATRKFAHVLALLETHSLQKVVSAADEAIGRTLFSPEAIELLLVQANAKQIAPLQMDSLPEKARVSAPYVDLSHYQTADLLEVA